MEFIDTSDIIDTITRVKPDAILVPRGYYDTTFREFEDPEHPEKFMCSYVSYADLVWEFKPTVAQDPFDDKVDKTTADPSLTQPLESDTKEAIRTRGQLIDYATQEKARIIRWDRSGCMSSEAFDYKSGENNYLGEFLWRYSHASRSQRGLDDTAVEATLKEVQVLPGPFGNICSLSVPAT